MHVARPRVLPVTYTYRDYRRIDMPAFRSYVRTSKSMPSPSAGLDDAMRQLDADLTAALDRHAPLRKRTKRSSTHDIPRLSPEAITAKQTRRRMEKRFARTKSLTTSVHIAGHAERRTRLSSSRGQPTSETKSAV